MTTQPRRQRTPTWKRAFRDALYSGAMASVASAAALALCGKLEGTTASGPINGPSQWVWGRGAAYRRRADFRHTVVGYAVHHLMATGWAVLHEKAFGRETGEVSRPRAQRLREGAITATAACLVDYKVAPRRLQPGFDVQLSKPSLLIVYAAFALGLSLGHSVNRRRGR
jgi:hypothetical protein